jgi:hypothetical protein
MIKQVAWQSMINPSGIKYEEVGALLKFNPHLLFMCNAIKKVINQIQSFLEFYMYIIFHLN